MSFSDYITSQSFQASLDTVFNNLMSKYNWQYKPDLVNFYNKYVDLIDAGQMNEVKFNQTASYYTDLETAYVNNSGLNYASNFIQNFISLSLYDFDVPENVMSPKSFFNDTILPQQKAQDTNTGSILGDALQKTGSQISSATGSIFSGIGDLLSKALTSLFSNPIVLIVVIGIILLIIFKDRILK
jgi:hypothetical protein